MASHRIETYCQRLAFPIGATGPRWVEEADGDRQR